MWREREREGKEEKGRIQVRTTPQNTTPAKAYRSCHKVREGGREGGGGERMSALMIRNV